MSRDYAALPSRPIRPRTTFHRPTQKLPPYVTPDHPALSVMTDFTQVTALTVDPDVSIDAASRVMKRRNVHLLVVVDVENSVIGLITSTDTQGEKPMQCIQARGGTRSDVLVKDIMTPHERLEVIAMEDVRQAKVGHVVATLEKTGRQHAAVVDVDQKGNQVLRGLFSASQLSRQLGEPVHPTPVARTFAEIEAALIQ